MRGEVVRGCDRQPKEVEEGCERDDAGRTSVKAEDAMPLGSGGRTTEIRRSTGLSRPRTIVTFTRSPVHHTHRRPKRTQKQKPQTNQTQESLGEMGGVRRCVAWGTEAVLSRRGVHLAFVRDSGLQVYGLKFRV